MLSSAYPVPVLRVWRCAMVLGWAAAASAGAWVVVSPPLSYEGVGYALNIAWGVMLGLGSLIVMVAYLIRSYQVELPGLALALGGVVIYDYLSWVQTLTTSPGAGPRALLLVLLACLIVARARLLIHLDREARRMIDLREEAA